MKTLNPIKQMIEKRAKELALEKAFEEKIEQDFEAFLVLSDLLSTIQKNANDNKFVIENVKEFCEKWKREVFK
jgi:hypothetical protein